MSSVDLAELKTEVTQLISTTQALFAHNPADVALRTKLQALLSLKQILDTQTLPPQQLEAVRQQIRALAPPPTPTPTFPPSTSVYPPQLANPSTFPQQFAPVAAPPSSAPPNVAQLLASFRSPVQHTPQPLSANPPALNLADLLKRVSSPTQSSSVPATAPFQPPFQGFPPPISTPVAVPQAAPPAPSVTPTANLAALLAQFNKPAAVPPVSHPTPVQSTLVPQLPPQPATVIPALGSAEWLLKALGSVPGALPTPVTPITSQPMTRQSSVPTNLVDQIELTTASMKQPRFHLISRLYETKPNICATCGRRFDATPEGKEKKARHMDWHFKVKDPDAAKRGVHRSWYIPEKEWIEYREVDETAPSQTSNDPNSAAGGAAKPKKQTKDRYVSVPQDVVLQQAPCPICQEKFETVWSVEANDFVWMDALNVGGKVYHATCFEEYSKGAGIAMPGTPDSVLGKRRADDGMGANGEGKKVRAF